LVVTSETLPGDDNVEQIGDHHSMIGA